MASKYDKLHSIHNYNVDLENNEIYLVGNDSHASGAGDDSPIDPGVEYVIANNFIKNLHLISALSQDGITVHLKLQGGYWWECMAIYDAIQACTNHITMINYAEASSASGIILQAADYRIMMPNSLFMLHSVQYTINGGEKEINEYTKLFYKQQTTMLDIYIRRLENSQYFEGKSRGQIRAWLKRQLTNRNEVNLLAEEAVLYGFADEVYDG